MLPWDQIDTVLLDMDGTLLDLHFDNHFWLEHLPKAYALKQQISVEKSKQILSQEYAKVHGTLSWYCLDYWANTLRMDLLSLKKELLDKIQLKPGVEVFLNKLHQANKQVILLTNAHRDGLAIKLEKTRLDEHLDTLISTHDYGVSKEDQSLWQAVCTDMQFDPARTLFIDDSLPILDAARRFGIAHLLAVSQPDSQHQKIDTAPYQAVDCYLELADTIIPA